MAVQSGHGRGLDQGVKVGVGKQYSDREILRKIDEAQ